MGSQVGVMNKVEIGFNTCKNQMIYKSFLSIISRMKQSRRKNMYTNKMKVLIKISLTTKLFVFLKTKINK